MNVKPGARYCTWSVEADGLLGKLSDEEVAGRLGYSVTRVRRRRHLLGVPCGNPTNRPWTKAEIALLGTRPDREVAPLVNRSLANVRYKRLDLGIPFCNPRYEIWKPAELALLGKVSDAEIAAPDWPLVNQRPPSSTQAAYSRCPTLWIGRRRKRRCCGLS